jgi:hypothetical protein
MDFPFAANLPAMSDVPKPGFLPQAADPVGESAGVAKPPPTSLTELVHGGGSAYKKTHGR